MPFGIIGQTGLGMRQVFGYGDRCTGRGTFGGEFGARHCNQWGLFGVRVLQRRDAALFPNYFGQTLIFGAVFRSAHMLCVVKYSTLTIKSSSK